MEAFEEPPLNNSAVDDVKENIVCDGIENSTVVVNMDVCHKSNGVAETADTGSSDIPVLGTDTETSSKEEVSSEPVIDEKTIDNPEQLTNNDEAVAIPLSEIETTVETAKITVEGNELDISKPSEHGTAEEAAEVDKTIHDNARIEETIVAVVTEGTDILNERVIFETEILVETNDNDNSETESKIEEHVSTTNNLLSELGHSIEMSEALRSSDVTDNVENNNCGVRQEMFNKEELLDILEGNDVETSVVNEKIRNMKPTSKLLEAQLALEQLSRLKRTRRKFKRNVDKVSRGKKNEKTVIREIDNATAASTAAESASAIISAKDAARTVTKAPAMDTSTNAPIAVPIVDEKEAVKEESIVNDLVKDWDDEETLDEEQSSKLLEESKKLQKTTVQQENVSIQEEMLVRTSIDSSTSEGQSSNINKSGDDGQPQRRLGRVIKKKVIYDPDNPDTFTKNKSANKNKETQGDKEQHSSKKIKLNQIIERAKSKSPVSKMQWKKPTLKNNKQNKRLTEVDKLLMDEGAVNMIYQLTPEAPKGKKNMKTKAEFIKKIQSSTPDSKEMKFRERKKEARYEESEAKKILGGKPRSSLSSSVKSPSVSEDFEAHSADDSIIYRRHSSSSYSSSCMSPRRLSDVEGGASQSAPRSSRQPSDTQKQKNVEDSIELQVTDMFMSYATSAISSEIINKNDCLSIKEKLNTKLSLALNKKRKREANKIEKPLKQKKNNIADEKPILKSGDIVDLKHLVVKVGKKLAEICIRNTQSKYNVVVIKEIENILSYINLKKDVSVTLLTFEDSSADLDLTPLLVENSEKRMHYAQELAESVRSLMWSMKQHSKLLCVGVNGSCTGLSLGLVALSDVSFASEFSTFALEANLVSGAASAGSAPLVPGIAALTEQSHSMHQPLLNDLLLLGRRLSAAEAAQGGLVTRTLWPHTFHDQVRALAGDLAAQPTHNVLLKKKLLNLTKPESDASFLSCLERERDLFVDYWTSEQGQVILQQASTPDK